MRWDPGIPSEEPGHISVGHEKAKIQRKLEWQCVSSLAFLAVVEMGQKQGNRGQKVCFEA